MPSPTHPLKQVAVASRTTSRECSPCHRTLTACASNAPSASIWSSVSADASPPRAVACATYLGRRRTSRHVSVSEVERCLPRAFFPSSSPPTSRALNNTIRHTEGSLGSAGLALGRSPGGQQPRQQLLRMMCMPPGASPQQRSAAAWLLPGGRRLCGGAARPSCCARWRGQGAAAAPHGRGTRQGANGPAPPRPPASPLCPGSARPGLSPPCDTRSRDTAAPLPCGAAGKGGRLQKHLVPKRAAPQSTAAPCVVCARASRVTQAPRQDATCKVSARAFQHRVCNPPQRRSRGSPLLSPSPRRRPARHALPGGVELGGVLERARLRRAICGRRHGSPLGGHGARGAGRLASPRLASFDRVLSFGRQCERSTAWIMLCVGQLSI